MISNTELIDNHRKWKEQVEILARHLCTMKGIDPDYDYTPFRKAWQSFEEPATNYLNNRVMNKYYWENLVCRPD